MIPSISRRQWLKQLGGGAGALALQSMLAGDVAADKSENKKSPHHEVKAKNVIWLFMNGGPSGIDTFDYKPELAKYHGKVFEGEVKTLFPHPGPLMESPFKFNRYGESGLPISEIYSNVAKHADDLCVINSCTSTQLNHVPACYMMNTGVSRVGSPSIGSFATYGLGTENSELPGFVVMMDRRSAPEGGANLWDSGFLPPKYQGVPFRNDGEPVLFLDRSVSRGRQQNRLKFLAKLNQEHLNRNPHNRDLETRIQSFETAYKMQASVPDLMKVDDETEDTKRIYGLDDPDCEHFGTQLLLARRMVERGVRFQQIFHGGWKRNWDSHGSLGDNHRSLAKETDKPIAGLLRDLKARGLLESTLVIWGGEFGRLPMSQDIDGRDHNPYGFTMWMAGGGAKKGYVHGKTDELGYRAVESPVSMNDLHATILHLMGVDHERLSYWFSGRDQTMTNSLGSVVFNICNKS